MFYLDVPALWVLNSVENWQFFSLKKSHVERLFFLMAFRRVVFVGLHMLLCKKLRVSLIVPSGRIALIRCVTCGTAGGMVSSSVNLHSLVAGSLYPVNTVFPYLFTCTVCFLNVTVYPLSHSTGMDMRGSYMQLNLYAIFDFSGSQSIFILHCMCALLLFPSGSRGLISSICLL